MSLEPDPRTLGPNPADFAVEVRVFAGPSDGPGEESFDLTVCTPEWLGQAAGSEFYSGRHHLIINADSFSVAGLSDWVEARLRAATGSSWTDVAEGLSRWAHWEFEDYQP
jgi:hypothetical protein